MKLKKIVTNFIKYTLVLSMLRADCSIEVGSYLSAFLLYFAAFTITIAFFFSCQILNFKTVPSWITVYLCESMYVHGEPLLL